VMGGHNNILPLETVESMDPREGIWREEPEMLYHRAYPATTSSGECIFAVGGNFGGTCYSTSEVFDARKGRWMSLPSLNIQRNGAAVALIGDSLYCVGGFDGSREVLSTCETLDLSKDILDGKWEILPELMTPRDGCAMEVIKDRAMQVEMAERMRR